MLLDPLRILEDESIVVGTEGHKLFGDNFLEGGVLVLHLHEEAVLEEVVPALQLDELQDELRGY